MSRSEVWVQFMALSLGGLTANEGINEANRFTNRSDCVTLAAKQADFAMAEYDRRWDGDGNKRDGGAK